MRNIDCLILSTGRAASTSIYYYLNQCANLGLPWNKEPHTLIDVKQYSNRSHVLDEIYVSDLNAYESMYSDSKCLVDASVGYFFYVGELVAKLQELKQNPKVIFLYREPVSRAVSLFNELRKKGFEQSKTLEEALSKDKQEGLWWENYYDNVPYLDHFLVLKSYFRDVLPISYTDMAAKPAKVMERVLAFLGLKVTAEIQYVRYNSSAQAGAIILARRWPMLRRILPSRVKQGIASIYTSLHRGSQQIVPDGERYLGYSMEQYRLFREYIDRG